MSIGLKFHGSMPANLLPFRTDYSVNEKDYRRHLSWLADAPGVTAIVCNGHAAEVASLMRDERRRTLAVALDEVGSRIPLVAGIYSDGTLEAVALARDAADEGAAGLLIFPPTFFNLGAQLRPEMAYRHFAMIADAVALPLVIFQYPPAAGIGYTPEILVQLTEIPNVAAIKEWSNDIVAFERNLKAVREAGRNVAVMSSFSTSLLSSLVLGADGLISGLGSVIPELQAWMFHLVQTGDLKAARELNDRLHPLVSRIYQPPFLDMHNRMKEALVMLGRLDPPAVVRPPLMKITATERTEIEKALELSEIGAGYGWEGAGEQEEAVLKRDGGRRHF